MPSERRNKKPARTAGWVSDKQLYTRQAISMAEIIRAAKDVIRLFMGTV